MRSLILIAEDDLDDRFLLESAFAETGDDILIHFVENGAEAIAYLESASKGESAFPQLLMLDLNMPKLDGKEVLMRVRQNDVFADLPVIIYTTTSNEADIRHCYELGANTYIVKPSDFDTLRNVVASLKSYWLSTAVVPHHPGV